MTDRGDWMQTYTGAKFYPMSPRAEDVDPIDIAHSLSLLCRYNGHIDRFYSVGEHCVALSFWATGSGDELWALLHDATEAYVGDMIRPLKLQQPSFVEAENRVMAAICERFGLDPEMPAAVKEADARILLTERAALMPNTRHPWVVDGLEPLPVLIAGWEPRKAEKIYLGLLKELGAL